MLCPDACDLLHYININTISLKLRERTIYSQGGVTITKCNFFFQTDKGHFFNKTLKLHPHFVDMLHRYT
jgi:hypothetical protein